jgi:putative flavoprotein involved in K+ transport
VRSEDRALVIETSDGRQLQAAGIVAASGSFSNPHRPMFPGQERFTGQRLPVAEYRNPAPSAVFG